MNKIFTFIITICVVFGLAACNSKQKQSDSETETSVYFCVTRQYDDIGVGIKELMNNLIDGGYRVGEVDSSSELYDSSRLHNPTHIVAFHGSNSRNGFIYEFKNTESAEVVYNTTLRHDDDGKNYLIELYSPADMIMSLVRTDNLILCSNDMGMYDLMKCAGIEELPEPITLNVNKEYTLTNALTNVSTEYSHDEFIENAQKKGLIAFETKCIATYPCSPELFLTTNDGMVVAEVIPPKTLEDGEATAIGFAVIETREFTHFYTSNGYLIKTLGKYADDILSTLG